jgi:hypothetical protein
VSTFWQVIGPTFQAVLISLSTVTVLALLRLITPAVRWSRQLRHDREIYSALPDGREKEMWAQTVTAQAERLRLYREDRTFGAQAVAWYAFFVLAASIVALFREAAMGWPNVRTLTVADIPVLIPGTLLLIMNLGAAVVITVQLVRGRSIYPGTDPTGHYPKYIALQRAAHKRSMRRLKIVRRLAAIQSREAQEQKKANRARAKRKSRSRPAPTNE